MPGTRGDRVGDAHGHQHRRQHGAGDKVISAARRPRSRLSHSQARRPVQPVRALVAAHAAALGPVQPTLTGSVIVSLPNVSHSPRPFLALRLIDVQRGLGRLAGSCRVRKLCHSFSRDVAARITSLPRPIRLRQFDEAALRAGLFIALDDLLALTVIEVHRPVVPVTVRPVSVAADDAGNNLILFSCPPSLCHLALAFAQAGDHPRPSRPACRPRKSVGSICTTLAWDRFAS